MGKGGKHAAEAKTICEGALGGLGLDLVDVDFVKEGKHQVLRLFIDKAAGISLDDCAEATRVINPLLDADFSWAGPYLLEVSSPGLDRPLKSEQDLRRHIGRELLLRFYRPIEGQKELSGVLLGLTDEAIELALTDVKGRETGEKRRLLLSDCASIKQQLHL